MYKLAILMALAACATALPASPLLFPGDEGSKPQPQSLPPAPPAPAVEAKADPAAPPAPQQQQPADSGSSSSNLPESVLQLTPQEYDGEVKARDSLDEGKDLGAAAHRYYGGGFGGHRGFGGGYGGYGGYGGFGGGFGGFGGGFGGGYRRFGGYW